MKKTNILKKLSSGFIAFAAVFGMYAGICGSSGTIQVNAASSPSVVYQAHCQNIGWMNPVSDGSTCGTVGRSLRLEYLNVKINGCSGGIKISTHQAGIGWVQYSSASSGNWAGSGTVGQSRSIEAVKLQLYGNVANSYNITYRVHSQNVGWGSFVSNNAVAGTTGKGLRAEAIEIKLSPKSTITPKIIVTNKNTTTKYYVKTQGSNLTVRSGPSTGYKKIGSFSNGSQVDVYSISSGWAKVKYGSSIGYVYANYLTTVPIITTNTKLSYALYKNSSARLTCGFDGYVNTSGKHEGIDFSLAVSKPIYSLTDGVITRIANGYRGKNGLSTIAIYYASQNKTVIYLHSAPLSSLRVGQTIKKGQQIGNQDWRGVSSSGSSHTHVEVRNGRCTGAAKSLNDYTLENPDPTSFWNSLGYSIG